MGIKGHFTVKIGDELFTYNDYDDIPQNFDHVISFLPDIPPEPHSDDQHSEFDSWNEKLQRLMEIENASSNKKR